MKKLGLLALAALLVVAFTMPAAAIESEFGGYWRTRFYTNQNFTGEDETEAKDFSWVDTRTRLYYTAIFHENLKFVNKFEWDAVWGTGPLGDVGADGKELEIKNSYADFNVGPVNAKVGIQGVRLARGFLVDDDFSAAVISFNGDMFSIPVMWLKPYEGGKGKDANDRDIDYVGIAPSFNMGSFKINPYLVWAYSDNISKNYTPTFISQQSSYLNNLNTGAVYRLNEAEKLLPEAQRGEWSYDLETSVSGDEMSVFWLGVDLDVDFEMASLWFTGIYQTGSIDKAAITVRDVTTRTDINDMVTDVIDASAALSGDVDVSAWLLALGGQFNLGMFDIHGQGFYASGDDDADDDIEVFFAPDGQSYYWAEIMGYGIFDNQVSAQAPADKIGNIMAFNVGAGVKPMDQLSITLDVWSAWLAEDIVTLKGQNEDYLGTEVDLVITYKLLEGLNLDLVGAYLFAGDATTLEHPDDANPYEIGSRLSLSF